MMRVVEIREGASSLPAIAPAAAPERPSLCLTDAELSDLVGSPLAGLQMEWLDAQRWPYVLTRRGKPRVARALFEQRMGVTVAANDAGVRTEPDWSAYESK